ncbi:MAG: hypothetical protein ACE5F1_08340 [Planctomycetota bacterium]
MPSFLKACEARGFVVGEPYKKGWMDHIRDMPLLKVQLPRGQRLVSVDVSPLSTPFQESAFGRLVAVEAPNLGPSILVITPADLILFKLMADRPKDRLDVLNTLTIQGIPEGDYLRDWAVRLGVEDRLDRALAEAGL